jgi:hypothetical protein
LLYGFLLNDGVNKWDLLGNMPAHLYDGTGDRPGCCYAEDLRNIIESDPRLKAVVERLSSGENPCLTKISCDCSDLDYHCAECAKNGGIDGAYKSDLKEVRICGSTMNGDGSTNYDKIREDLRHELQHASQCGKYDGNCKGDYPGLVDCVNRLKAEYEARVCENKSFGFCSPEYIRTQGKGPCLKDIFDQMTNQYRNGQNHAICPGCARTFGGSDTSLIISKIREAGENISTWITEASGCFK